MPTELDELLTVYGRALYLAQSMETGMRIFYCLDRALPSAPPGKNPRVDFDAEPLPDATMNSLGGFLRQFRREMMSEGAVDVQTRGLMRKLEQSADYRNWLVHTFWWEHLAQLDSEVGRQAILTELQELIKQFEQHNAMIYRMVLLCLNHYGYAPAQIDAPKFHHYLRQGEMATEGAVSSSE